MVRVVAPSERQTAFRVVIPKQDSQDFEAITDTILETAGILPNTSVVVDEHGHHVVTISMADDYRWGHVVDRVRQLTFEYERLLQRRELAKRRSASDFRWHDFTDGGTDD